MELNEAMQLVWNNKRYTPKDIKQAISHLNEEVAEGLKYYLKGDEERAKQELEDALSCLLIVYKTMNIDIEAALNRQIEKMKSKSEKTMIIRKDRVDLYVNGELKGGWSIWHQDDVSEARKIAFELGCEIIYDREES